MDHLTGMVLGGLLGWTATLFLEHRQWLPSRSDLLSGMLGGLCGSVAAGMVAVDMPTNVESLAALAGAGMAIALWRAARNLTHRRTTGNQAALG